MFVVGDDSYYEAEGMRNGIGMLHSINVAYVTYPTTSHAQEPKRLLTKKIAVKSMQHLARFLTDRVKKQFVHWLGACQVWSLIGARSSRYDIAALGDKVLAIYQEYNSDIGRSTFNSELLHQLLQTEFRSWRPSVA
jgi:hypothetical protein